VNRLGVEQEKGVDAAQEGLALQPLGRLFVDAEDAVVARFQMGLDRLEGAEPSASILR
jgi:hypothetical protein